MMGLQPFELALIAAVILAALELLAGTFILLGFALGCLSAASAEFISGTFDITRDVLLFAVTATVAIVALRRFFARPGDVTRAKGDVNDY